MNLVMICQTLPSSTGGGPRNNQWIIADTARQRGHNVVIVWLHASITERNRFELQCLAGRGIQVVPVEYAAASPTLIAQIIHGLEASLVFGLATYTVAWAAATPPSIPKVCMMGDLEHQVQVFRRQYDDRANPLDYNDIAHLHQAAINVKNTYMPILESCQAVICSAAHSVHWMNQQGIPAEYVPMPIVDPAFPGWRRRIEDMPQNPKPRILLAGHLNGIATKSGLYYLAEEILPHLDVDAYEWRICGDEKLDPELATRFRAYPQVQCAGYVEDIRAEVLQADISLIPTPIPMGVRTRLIECWGLGACVVAHAANSVGQPECDNGRNILLAETGDGIADFIRHAVTIGTEGRMEMGNKGRETFDQHFATPHSAGRIVEIMERVAQ